MLEEHHHHRCDNCGEWWTHDASYAHTYFSCTVDILTCPECESRAKRDKADEELLAKLKLNK